MPKMFWAMEKLSSQSMTELATEEKNDDFSARFDWKDVTTNSLMLVALEQLKTLLCFPKSRGLIHVKNSSHNNPAVKASWNSVVKLHKQVRRT